MMIVTVWFFRNHKREPNVMGSNPGDYLLKWKPLQDGWSRKKSMGFFESATLLFFQILIQMTRLIFLMVGFFIWSLYLNMGILGVRCCSLNFALWATVEKSIRETFVKVWYWHVMILACHEIGMVNHRFGNKLVC